MRNFEEMAHDYKTQSSHYACWEDKQERNINRSTDYCLLCCEVLDLLFLQLLHEHFVHVQDPPQLQVPAAHKKKSVEFHVVHVVTSSALNSLVKQRQEYSLLAHSQGSISQLMARSE